MFCFVVVLVVVGGVVVVLLLCFCCAAAVVSVVTVNWHCYLCCYRHRYYRCCCYRHRYAGVVAATVAIAIGRTTIVTTGTAILCAPITIATGY